MQNKIDKIFIITIILMVISNILSFIFVTVSFIIFLNNKNHYSILTSIFFYLSLLFFIILIIGILILITTLIFKIISKNKTKKDWIIVLFNLFAIFTFFITAFIMILLIFNPV